MKTVAFLVAVVLLCGLCSCGTVPTNNEDLSSATTQKNSTTSTTFPSQSTDIPDDCIRFRIVTENGEPVVGAEMGCTSPWINGEQAGDYCLMGTTDEYGCLLSKAELGIGITFNVSIPGRKIISFDRDITQNDLGTEIIFTIPAP